MTHVREIAATDKVVAGSGNKRAKSFVWRNTGNVCRGSGTTPSAFRFSGLKVTRAVFRRLPVVKIDKDEVVDFGIIGLVALFRRSGSSADNASSTASVC